jgi:TRAP-type mannitol/chloroaromatic compound transport system substrate-binding protein
MKRIAFIMLALIMASAAALTGCGGGGGAAGSDDSGDAGDAAASAEQITWRVQGYGASGTLYDEYGKRLADRITEVSGGRLVIDFYPADAIFAAAEVPNATRDGIVDAVYAYGGQYTGINEAFALLAATPGMFARPFDILTWMKEGGGMELWQECMDAYDMKQHVLLCGVHDAENFLWSNVAIREIEDMRGLTMRFMPIFGNVLSDHGMSCVSLPATEIIPSRERGVIDAGEYSIPAYDISMGFQDVAKYCIRPGFHQPSTTVVLNVNQSSWDALPDDLKLVVEAACNENIVRFFTDQRIRNIDALEEIMAAGVEIVYLSDDAIATLGDWTEEYLTKKSAEDEWVKKVVDSQKAFVRKTAEYSGSLDFEWPAWALSQ